MWNSQQKNIRFVQDSGFVWGDLFFDVQARGMVLYLKTSWFNTTRSVSISSLGQGSLVCFWGLFFQLGQTPVSHVVFWRWFFREWLKILFLPSFVQNDRMACVTFDFKPTGIWNASWLIWLLNPKMPCSVDPWTCHYVQFLAVQPQ